MDTRFELQEKNNISPLTRLSPDTISFLLHRCFILSNILHDFI